MSQFVHLNVFEFKGLPLEPHKRIAFELVSHPSPRLEATIIGSTPDGKIMVMCGDLQPPRDHHCFAESEIVWITCIK